MKLRSFVKSRKLINKEYRLIQSQGPPHGPQAITCMAINAVVVNMELKAPLIFNLICESDVAMKGSVIEQFRIIYLLME